MDVSDFFLLLALPILLVAIVLFLAIAINAYIAGCFADIAAEKGFEERKYFWIPFLFGIIGYLMVIALPDRLNLSDGEPIRYNEEVNQ